MWMCSCKPRCRKVKTKHKCSFCLLVTLIILCFVHVYLIPSFTESYNSNCYLDKKSLQSLTYMLKNIIELFEKHGVEYWLDYGTLLGAKRYRSIIPWDGDGDISYMMNDVNVGAALQELNSRGIHANTMIAQYNGMNIDFMRWFEDEGHYKGEKQTLLYKYYPSWVADNAIVKLNHKLDAFPVTWIGRRKKMTFLSTLAYVPEYHEKLIRFRYKWTFWFSMPYKWKCYVPCFIYNKDPSCNT